MGLFGWGLRRATYARQTSLEQSLTTSGVEGINVQFVTFNYTDTISRIVNAMNSVNETNAGKPDVSYLDPLYIHGKLEKCLILGVDSDEQCGLQRKSIAEWGLRSDYKRQHNAAIQAKAEEEGNLRQLMLKPRLNTAVRPQEVSQIENSVLQADKILIFGSSLGETDNHWWRLIAKWLIDVGDNGNDMVKHRHQLGVLAYYKGMDSVSATAQLGLEKIKNRFEQIVNSTSKSTPNGIGKDILEVKKCEDWMFSFASDGKSAITVAPERLFPGLTMGIK